MMKTPFLHYYVFQLFFLWILTTTTDGFQLNPHPHPHHPYSPQPFVARPTKVPAQYAGVGAGGFQWEDPSSSDSSFSFDQGVENPFKKKLQKNTERIQQQTSTNENVMDMEMVTMDTMAIDPARLLSPRLNGVNVYLIGMMGSGKTAVGNILARRMRTYSFIDTDDIIEQAAGMSISNIFETEGEDAFRTLEAQILDSVHPHVRCIISTGGGIVCRRENWSKLHTGIVVWLDCDPEIIVKRIHTKVSGSNNRPLLSSSSNPVQTLKELLETRRDQYAQADVRVEITADMSEKATATAIIRDLHNFIDDNPPYWKTAKAKAQAEGIDWVQ